MAVSLNTALGAFPITALAGTSYVPLAGGTMTGALTIASGTLTASAPALSITQTWTTGAAFTGALMNITDTSSTAGSLLQDWQVGGTSKASIAKNGLVTAAFGIFGALAGTGASINYFNAGIRSVSAGEVAWTSGNVNGVLDLALYRDAAATLAQRNGTNAQKLRIYGTADGSPGANYQRMVLSANGTTGVTIAAEGLGTPGANQNITLTPGGTGVNHLNAAVNWVNNNATIRNTDATGTGRLYLDVSNVVFRRGDGASSPGMWKFGGETSGSPGIKASGTTLQSRLADDSGYGSLESLNFGQTGYHQMTEMTAPSAPAANSVRIYAEDNGAGKTRLMALFATGSAVQLGIEP